MAAARCNGLSWRIALHPRLGMTIAEAEGLTFVRRRQCAAILDALAWQDEQAALDRIADTAIANAARGAWR